MATNNAVNTSLSGQSGTGSFAGTVSPAFTTPRTDTIYSNTNNTSVLNINGVASAVNVITISNAITANPCNIQAIGTDTNVSLIIGTKGTGFVTIYGALDSAGTAFKVQNGTGYQHVTSFIFSNTSALRSVTFPDADGTVAFLNSPTFVTPVLGAATATSINFGQTTLSNYQEGTWTPVDNSGASLTFTTVVGNYTRIGRMVTASCTFVYPSTVSGASASIGGLPFNQANSAGSSGGHIVYSSAATAVRLLSVQNSATCNIYAAAGTPITNATMSLSTNYFQITYFV